MFMFLSCDYNGVGKKRALKSYKGFRVSEDGVEDKIFVSDDPVKDFQEARWYIAERIAETGCRCGRSSSVDNFVMDCRGVFEWYTDVNGNEVFDLAEKAKALEAEHTKERTQRCTAVWNFLQMLGVPKDIAEQDTRALFFSCSEKTLVALANHYKSLK
jgi:hypothetical protein